MNHWLELGSFSAPASGVVATSTKTYVGTCGPLSATGAAAVAAELAACDPVVNSGAERSAAPRDLTTSLTVVAGTLDVPADLEVWSSLGADPETRLGLVSTGDTVLPHWAHGSGSALTVDASVLALGRSAQAPVRSDPAAPGASVRDPALRSSTLALTGSVAAPQLALSTGAFASTTFTPAPGTLVRSAPYFGGASLNWERLDDKRLSAARVNDLGLGGE
jgi:hypothetical protein